MIDWSVSKSFLIARTRRLEMTPAPMRAAPSPSPTKPTGRFQASRRGSTITVVMGRGPFGGGSAPIFSSRTSFSRPVTTFAFTRASGLPSRRSSNWCSPARTVTSSPTAYSPAVLPSTKSSPLSSTDTPFRRTSAALSGCTRCS
jgi:hypothetical protein